MEPCRECPLLFIFSRIRMMIMIPILIIPVRLKIIPNLLLTSVLPSSQEKD